MFATVQWKCRQPAAAGSLTYARFTVVVVLVCLLSWSATIEAQVRQIKLDASSLGVVPPRIGRYVLAKDRCWANKNSRHGGVDATFQFRLQEDQFKGIDIKLSWQESGTDGSAHDVKYGPQARFFNADSRSAYFAASDTHQVHVYIRLNNGASLDQKSLDQIADDVISRTNRRAQRLPVHVLAANFPKQFQGQTLGKVWTVESKNGDWSEINANYGTPRGGGASDAFHIELTLYRNLSGDYWPRDERLMEGTSKLVSSSRVLAAEYSLRGNRAASTDSVRKLAAEVMVRLEPLAAKRPDSASNQTAQSPPILTSPMTRQDDQPTGASRLSPAELVAVTAVLVSLLLGAGVTVNVTQSVVTSIVTSIQAGVDLTSQDIANLIGDAKKQTGETRTIVLSGDAAQDVRNRGVGANIHVSGSDRYDLDLSSGDQHYQDGYLGDRGRVTSFGPKAEDEDGNIWVSVDVQFDRPGSSDLTDDERDLAQKIPGLLDDLLTPDPPVPVPIPDAPDVPVEPQPDPPTISVPPEPPPKTIPDLERELDDAKKAAWWAKWKLRQAWWMFQLADKSTTTTDFLFGIVSAFTGPAALQLNLGYSGLRSLGTWLGRSAVDGKWKDNAIQVGGELGTDVIFSLAGDQLFQKLGVFNQAVQSFGNPADTGKALWNAIRNNHEIAGQTAEQFLKGVTQKLTESVVRDPLKEKSGLFKWDP